MNRMDEALHPISSVARRVMGQSLYRNSIFLLLAGVVNGGFSFIYWVVAAHLYTQAEVGRATALFAAVSMMAGFGTLGFNNSLIRYLPSVRDRNDLLNTAYTIVGLAATLAGAIFLLVIPLIASKLQFVRQSGLFMLVFELFVVSTAISVVLDNNFVAYRSTHYTLLKNFLLNVFELMFLLAFLGLGSFGLFASYGLSFFLVAIISFGIMRRKFGFVPHLKIHVDIVRTVAKYSLVNYFTTFISSFPAFALPLLVTSTLGASANAIYFVAYNVASILFLIPLGIANAMFAEASHDEETLRYLLVRVARITATLLVPGLAIVTLFAPEILYLFGKHYSEQGVSVLRILALCGLCYAVTYPCGAILNVMHRLRPLIFINVFAAAAVIGLARILMQHGGGLTGAAWGWSLGWSATAFAYALTVAFALSGASPATAGKTT